MNTCAICGREISAERTDDFCVTCRREADAYCDEREAEHRAWLESLPPSPEPGPTVTQREDGRWVPYEADIHSGSTTYHVHCECGTGRYSGWNFDAVVAHSSGYAHRSSAVRAWRRQFS
jgi:hypothetical protein